MIYVIFVPWLINPILSLSDSRLLNPELRQNWQCVFNLFFCYLLEHAGENLWRHGFCDRIYRPECEADRIYGERGSEVIAEVEELASVLASLNAICAMSLLNIVSLLSAKRVFFFG